MATLGRELSQIIKDMNPDAAKFMRISRYRLAYVDAVRRTWADNPAAAELILDHTNAFYIRKDDKPRKGPDKDKPYIVAEAYLDDSMLLSELNARREMVKLALAYEDIHVEEFRIIGSRMGMRKRHPFAKREERQETVGNAAQVDGDAPHRFDEAELLETVKRAFCLTFGEKADIVLSMVNAAAIELVRLKGNDVRRSSWRWYWLHLYAEDADRLSTVVKAYEEQITANARKLNLNIRAVQVHQADEDMRGHQAFPAVGAPVPYRRLNQA